jgi:hypothetical protein
MPNSRRKEKQNKIRMDVQVAEAKARAREKVFSGSRNTAAMKLTLPKPLASVYLVQQIYSAPLFDTTVQQNRLETYFEKEDSFHEKESFVAVFVCGDRCIRHRLFDNES